jgi:hypothetical protein
VLQRLPFSPVEMLGSQHLFHCHSERIATMSHSICIVPNSAGPRCRNQRALDRDCYLDLRIHEAPASASLYSGHGANKSLTVSGGQRLGELGCRKALLISTSCGSIIPTGKARREGSQSRRMCATHRHHSYTWRAFGHVQSRQTMTG